MEINMEKEKLFQTIHGLIHILEVLENETPNDRHDERRRDMCRVMLKMCGVLDDLIKRI